LISENGADLEFCSNDSVTWLVVIIASYRVPTEICRYVYELKKCRVIT